VTEEEFDLEYPVGSQKRQEEVRRLEAEKADQPVNDGSDVPEEVWRRNG
jgi:hypothetical protein